MFLLVCLLFIIVFIIYAVDQYKHKEYSSFVIKNSILLNKLNEINSKYHFLSVPNFDQAHIYDNENFYDSISCEDYLLYQLQFKKKNVEDAIKCVETNKETYELYRREISSIYSFGQFLLPINGRNIQKLIELEKNFFEKQRLKPTLNFNIHIALKCSLINGRVYATKDRSFSAEYVLELIKRLNNKDGTFYIDKGIWDALCRVERGRVSNRMRFSIYKRDGYRCRMCGKSGTFGTLEIDHIKPIAKGGKSTYDNLQTLCKSCNQKKGDNYFN